jgi:hypothetical protein
MTHRGLFVFIGESFRYGKETTRMRGGQISFEPQMAACRSHLKLLDRVKTLGVQPSVLLATYTTPFDSDLCAIYKPYMHTTVIMNQASGFNYLFRRSMDLVLDIDSYDFVMYIRIDIELTDLCISLVDPFKSTIIVPNVLPSNTEAGYPMINDMFVYFPKQFVPAARQSILYHTLWNDLVIQGHATNSDFDVMITTYHDSDTAKDTNPLYTIVNRPKAKIWKTPNRTFMKNEVCQSLPLASSQPPHVSTSQTSDLH